MSNRNLMKTYIKAKSVFGLVAGIGLTAIMALSCSRSRDGKISGSFEHPELIRAYTTGAVTDGTPVRILFTSTIPDIVPGTDADPRLLSFSPALKGSAMWASGDVLEFIPDGYRQGTVYKATLRLGRIPGTGAKGKFTFSFYAAPKEAYLRAGQVRIPASNPGTASIYGTVEFSEEVSGEAAAAMLSCKYDGKVVPLTVTKAGNLFAFKAEGLERGTEDRIVSINFNGKAHGFRNKGAEKITVPGTDSFHVLDAQRKSGDDPYVEVQFSNPLDRDSDPAGMFTLGGAGKYYTEIEDNIVKLYYEKDGEDISLEIASGICDISGTRLGTPFKKEFSGSEAKPAVEIPMSGSILPDPDNLILPFRSINLSAVDISIIKIYESNILMFLQTNRGIDGSDELRRSGRLIYRKTMHLDNDPGKDLHKWQDFCVDLSGLIRQEPGAIYRIRLSFKQEYSLYGRSNPSGYRSSMAYSATEDITEEEAAAWDEPYPYYYENFYDWKTYSWNDRDDPSTPSYYMVASRFPEKNILSSNVGIVAKSSESGRIWVTINDIITSKPIQGAKVAAYSYQLQTICEVTTDKDGFAEIKLDGSKAFALTAKAGKSVGYLKITDGNEKSMSRFDTGGKQISAGIKGFVYGERGVWRPGDTLHVTIIVEDRLNNLPDNHPVTAELYTPQGQFYDRQISTKGTDGMYSFALATKEDDPTGTWNAYFKVGGATFHKALNVETVKPNRLKTELDIKDKMLSAGKSTAAVLNASWLTGARASGLGATVEMTLQKGNASFKGYEGYVFTDPTSQFSSTTSTILSGRLDKSGRLSAQIKMPHAKDAPGMLSATLLTRISEPGGDENFTSRTMPFSPYGAYVGVKFPQQKDGSIETDKDHEIAVVTLDKNGKPVEGHELEYKIYKLAWSWWWESRGESLDSYVNGTAASPVSSGKITSSGNAVTIPFRIDYPEWGRYLVYVKDLTGGHASGGTIYADWPSWRGRADRKDPDGLTMLSFSLDKKSYVPGEEATVFIPAAKDGKALVSLENSTGVISRTWVKTDGKTETPYRFPIKEGMAPNFYVHITLLQPHGNSDNDLPIRMYGVQPVFVDDPMTHLNPEITMPDVLRPQQEFTVKVKEKNGRRMSYTLAIVDEGLLDITSFKTPDPWQAMYEREALGVKTWDLYDDVVGAFSGRFSPLFSIGGDENVLRNNRRDNRFNPVVKFLGPFSLPAKGTGIHKITLPMYIGSVKAMVVAGADGAYGNASVSVPVKSPLMMLSSLPRVLGTGEKVTLPVNVFAMENDVKNVKVKVEASGAARISGTSSKFLQFSAAGDKIADFSIETGASGGTAEIRISAKGDGHSASETLYIKVRNPEPYVTSVFREQVFPGKNVEINYGSFTPAGDEERASVELAGFPSVDFSGCFGFVSDYSHHCTEQLSAKGLTMLYLSGLVQENDRKAAQEAIPQIIKQICSRQLNDGGFAYWPGQSHADEWATSMAGQFLTEAAAEGYEVNAGVLNSWKKFQKRCIGNYRESGIYDLGDLVQAYRLYTLALASDPDTGAMNRLKSSASLSGQAAWRLAATYAVSGKKAIAKEMTASLKTVADSYGSSNRTYGSSFRDRAMYLETLVLIDDLAAAMNLARELAYEFEKENCYTTQNTAFLAAAMSRLAEKANKGVLEAVITEKSGKEVKSAKSVYVQPLDPSAGKVGIRNNSEGVLYATVTTRRQTAPGATEAASSGLGIEVNYKDSEGQILNLAGLRQRTDIYAEVTVSNTGGTSDYTGLALTVAAPSGWEIFNGRLTGTDSDNPEYTYMDIRDDKVIYYFDLGKGTKKQFRLRFNAAYCGEFVVPSVRCEAMYDPAVFARTASATTAVLPF